MPGAPHAGSSSHALSVSLRWEGGQAGAGRLATAGLGEASVGAPTTLGGSGQGTSPEELLLASAAGCYAITLAGILERMRLPVAGIELRSEADVEAGPPLHLASILHRPLLRLGPGGDAARARRAALLAEEHCMISRAVRGNVLVRVEAEIVTG